MDFSSVMDEQPISNLNWLKFPETFDSAKMKKNNDIKEDLMVEFGSSSAEINDGTSDKDSIQSQMKVLTPDNSVETVVRCAKILMMQGIMGKSLATYLKKTFDPDTLKVAEESLREVFSMQGLIGCAVVDPGCFDDCSEVDRVASASPYKKFQKYAFTCSRCEGCQHLFRGQEGFSVIAGGGSVDGFFQDREVSVDGKPYCRLLNRVMLANSEDLPEKWVSDTMIDISQLSGMSEDDLQESGKSAAASDKIRRAFIAFDRKIKESKRAAYDTSSSVTQDQELASFSLDRSAGNVDVPDQKLPAREAVDDSMGKRNSFIVDVDPEALSEGSLDFGIDPSMISEVDLGDVVGQIDPDMLVAPIDADNAGFANDGESGIDVDESPYLGEEFAGIDIVDVDGEKPEIEFLDVDPRGSIQV